MNNLEILRNSDFIISFGTLLSNTNEDIKEAIETAKKNNDATVVYTHAVDSLALKDFYTQFIKYEAGSEEGVAALILDTFVKESNETIQSYIDDLDIGYISAESSAGEEEFEEAYEIFKEKKKPVLYVGEDIFSHERVENISNILATIAKYSNLEIISSQELKTTSSDLEDVEELLPFNGSVIYSFIDDKNDSEVVYGSSSFARIAKVSDNTKVKVKYQDSEVNKLFKVDTTLQSTIAVCASKIKGDEFLSSGYVYKPVKIERLEE